MDVDEARSVLGPLLRGHSSWQWAMRPTVPGWLGVALTRVAVLLGDEVVAYLAGEYDAGLAPAEAHGTLAIFTPTRLLRVEVASGVEDDISVCAVARSSLRRIEVDGGIDLYGDPWPEVWPGPVAIRAFYPDVTIALPGGQLTDSQRARFLAFLPALFADMEPPRGR